MTAFVRKCTADATLFHNTGHPGASVRSVAGAYTHFELESLGGGAVSLVAECSFRRPAVANVAAIALAH
jgi:hypothetical protein